MAMLTCLLLLASCTPAFALREAELASQADILRAEEAADPSGTFTGTGGMKLHYEFHPAKNEIATLLFINGRGENSAKYAELYHDLKLMGYSVYTYDHRGQGRSPRLLADPHKLHVEHFSDYVDDLEAFLDQVVKPAAPRKLHLMGHSLGGLVGALYLERHSDLFRSASFLSPALALQLVMPDAQMEDHYCAGHPTDFLHGKDDDDVPFEKNVYTSSRERFAFSEAQKKKFPASYVGGPTRNWICEMVTAGEKARRHPSEIHLPVFVVIAKEDANTRLAETKKFCAQVKGCHLETIVGKHNLLSERDSVRDELLKRLDGFLKKH